MLGFDTFEKAVEERRWRLSNFDKWVPAEATMPDVSEVQRTVYTLNGSAPPPEAINGRNTATSAPKRFAPEPARGSW